MLDLYKNLVVDAKKMTEPRVVLVKTTRMRSILYGIFFAFR